MAWNKGGGGGGGGGWSGGGGGWSGGGGGGWGGGAFDYEAYKREAEERVKKEKVEQAVIDAITDPQERLTANRKRYNCGAKYVPLSALPRWSDVAPVLATLPNNSTVRKFASPPKWGGGYQAYGAAPVVAEPDELKNSDFVPRFPIRPDLNAKVCVYRGDITTLEIDAIVNAANGSMLGGGGIDGAIHGAAGGLLREECETFPVVVSEGKTAYGDTKSYGERCATGDTKLTKGYALPARYVLHTVGPIGGGDAELESCYSTVLKLVEDNGIRSVACCCVSTGIFDFPLVRATHIALGTARKWLEVHHEKVDLIVFCTFMEHEMGVYERLLPTYFPTPELPVGKK